MNEEKKLRQLNDKMTDYAEHMHEQNRRRIKNGLRCIYIVPAVFLFLMFATESSKIIFLVLWIVSLFGIAVYLIVVEYQDYMLQEKMKEFCGRQEAEEEGLLNGNAVVKKLQQAVERIEGEEE